MAVSVVNQWSGTFTQPDAFATMPPALHGVVLQLNVGSSVGGGSGTPTAGNWLMAEIGMSETTAAAGFTCAVNDGIHSWWRVPQVSTMAALTRSAIWYTPNTARQVDYVYVSPNGSFNAISVLVTEISGLGPWDTVTGASSNYAAAATSLTLSLPAPSAASAAFAMIAGDSTTAGQAFAPVGWTTLSTVSVTNGTDHLCDSVLTSAYLPSNSGSLSVTGTATSATDLSGVIIGLEINAPSPVPAGHNPNWPYLKTEIALGAGFQTPPDMLTWTDVTNRCWSWRETTGIQYQLDELQATNAQLELDNVDGALSADNVGSPYYSNALNGNMSFQSGVSPWTGYDGAALSQSSAFVFASAPAGNPQFSMLLTPDGVTAAPGAGAELVAVTGSTTYTISGWVYVPAGYATGINAGVNWYSAGPVFISAAFGSTIPIPAATWTQFTATLTSPSNAVFGQILLQVAGTPSAGTLFYLAEGAIVAGSSPVSTGLVTTGLPVRIRAAIGTIGNPAVTVNRWYVIQRNLQDLPQGITEVLRRYAPLTATDVWSILSAPGPTPYRGEVYQETSLYAWWAMDDQPGTGGVQPTVLRNIAPGNTNSLNISPSPNGVTAQDCYSSGISGNAGGTDITSPGGHPSVIQAASVAVYTAGAQQGWLPGDPQSVPFAGASGGPITASPGAAAWQVTGQQGNTGSFGWFLNVNDANFPSITNGITIEGWFNYGFLGSASGITSTTTGFFNNAAQPYCPLTLFELATASAPVGIMQLDISGHLNYITYNGATGTSHSVYSSSDLRNAGWFSVTLTLTPSTWAVYVNGGVTASASGSATTSVSAWTWLIVNGDLGASGGSTLSALVHGANVSIAHVSVYSSVLSLHRILAHYCAAVTGFGVVPVPGSLQLTAVASQSDSQFVPDGTEQNGSYGISAGTIVSFTFSAIAAAVIGSYTSGPSNRVTIAGIGSSASPNFGSVVWAQWVAVSPIVNVYTASAADAETEAAGCLGSGDSFTSGYGATASGHGVSQVSAGTGASPPSSPSALGDTVQQRIERIMGYGGATYPGRCIDAASQLVQAATDIGGQAAAQNVTNIAQSDGGLLFTDNLGNLTYWSRTHLAAQYSSPAWVFTPAAGAGQAPYYRDIQWIADPQRVWNAIAITPYSPDGAVLPLITPTSPTAVKASQMQYGAQPRQFTSYLQSQTEMQNQANWLLTEFGTLRIRIEDLRIEAAADPALWVYVLGMNVGDVATATNWMIGNTGVTGTFRVSQIERDIRFAGQDERVEASVTIQLDFEPSSYWS